MKKRGQVTGFFIAGAIILVLVLGFFGVKYMIDNEVFGLGLQKKGEIPDKIKPVQEFFDSCVEQTAKNGIDLMSSGGGYIYLDSEEMPVNEFNPIGKNLEIIPNSDLEVALWYRQKGNSLDEVNMPSMEDMEIELSTYVTNNYFNCIDNLTAFFDEGFDLESLNTSIETEVEILNGAIKVVVDYPVKVSIDEFEFSLLDHNAVIDTNYGKLYSVAREIFEIEQEEYLIENKTLDMLIAYDPEIPYAGTSNSCTPKIWSKTETITNIKEALFNNVAAMRVEGANYDLQEEKYEYMVLDLLKGGEDVEVNLMYSPSWPTLIDITPSEGDLLKGTSMGENGAWYMKTLNRLIGCLSTHHFVYDIKYPVLISVKNSDGDIFQFATQIVIDNNQPRVNTITPEPFEDTSSPICDFPTSPLMVDTYTYNAFSQYVPLADVDLKYKCYPAICDVDDVEGTNGEIMVPPCLNGILVGSKDGYFNGRTVVTAKEDMYPTTLVVLEPLYEKNIKVYVVDKEDGSVREPFESEQVIFQFSHLDQNYDVFYSYPDQTTIELIAGDYKIESQIYAETTWPVTTKAQKKTHCLDVADAGLLGVLGLASDQKCIDYEIPSMELEFAIKGGDEFEYGFVRSDLANTEDLKLYVMAGEVPSTAEEMTDLVTDPYLNAESAYFKYPTI